MFNIKLGKVAKNASWIIGCRIVQALIAFVISIITARYLGPSNFGLINYAASITAFVVPVVQLGITNVLVREIVDYPNREGEVLGTSLLMCVLSSIVCTVGVISFVAATNVGERETLIVCMLYSVNLIFQALEITRYWYQAKYLAKYASIVSFVAYVIVAIYKVYLLVSEKSVYWFAISNAFDYFLISIGLLILYKRLGGQRLKFSKSIGKQLLSKGRYYILSNLMIVIFAQTDRIMLKQMMGSEYTGYYSAAVTCAGMASFVFLAIIDSMRPYAIEGKQQGEKIYEDRIVKLYSIIIYLALSMSATLTLFARIVIQVMYGSEYFPAISALQVVAWYTTFSYFGGAKDVWILAEEKQKYLVALNMSGASANVILNLLLIPRFGIVGASIASLVTQFFTNVVMLGIIKPLRANVKLLVRAIDPRVIIRMLQQKKGD